MNWLLEEMYKVGADGVDFVPLGGTHIYATYTREEVANGIAVPRSDRRYWKWTNGNKEYLDKRQEQRETDPNPYLVHVDITEIARRHIHAALYSQDGKFGALNANTMSEMADELCDRWKPWVAYVIDPRNIGMALIDELVRRQVKVIPPKSIYISEWLPKADRR